jgi:hypothetical protein
MQDCIARTIEVWLTFSSYDGDIRYFSDAGLDILLFAIKEKFEEIQGLQSRLMRLDRICEDFGKAVSR